jgi:hypothetical protein
MSLPPANWYPDPSAPGTERYWDGNAWSASTRPFGAPAPGSAAPGSAAPGSMAPGSMAPAPPSPPKGRHGARLAIIFSVVALVIIGGGIAAVLGVAAAVRHASDAATNKVDDVLQGLTASPTQTQGDAGAVMPDDRTTSVDDVAIPGGWQLFATRSGSLAYARGSAWTDLGDAATEQGLLDAVGTNIGFTTEFGGMWAPGGYADPAGTSFTVMFMSYPSGTTDIQTEIDQFVQSNGASMGDTSPVKSLDEAFTSSPLYDGWRADYTVVYQGTSLYSTVIGLVDKETVVLVYGVSLEDSDTWRDNVATLADSVVVIGRAE